MSFEKILLLAVIVMLAGFSARTAQADVIGQVMSGCAGARGGGTWDSAKCNQPATAQIARECACDYESSCLEKYAKYDCEQGFPVWSYPPTTAWTTLTKYAGFTSPTFGPLRCETGKYYSIYHTCEAPPDTCKDLPACPGGLTRYFGGHSISANNLCNSAGTCLLAPPMSCNTGSTALFGVCLFAEPAVPDKCLAKYTVTSTSGNFYTVYGKCLQ